MLAFRSPATVQLGRTRQSEPCCRLYVWAYLSLHTAQFLLALELFVELAHASSANARGSKRSRDFLFASTGTGNVSLLLFLIFRNFAFAFIASDLAWIVIHIGVLRDLCDPLFFGLLVLAILAPSINPLLSLFIPDFLIPFLLLDTLGSSKAFPFRWWLWFWKRFCARQLSYRWG